MARAVFLDRDGVINEKASLHEYVTKWEDFKFLPGVLESLRRLAGTKYRIVITTNQRGIARGKMDESRLKEIHKRMLKEITKTGGRVDRVYYCPHNYGECDCRKPSPGMLDRAREEMGIDLRRSWVIGDSEEDVALGRARGCRTIYLGEKNINADYHPKSFMGAVDIILSFP
jgi:histidinol-phosphate phosphatase family protein